VGGPPTEGAGIAPDAGTEEVVVLVAVRVVVTVVVLVAVRVVVVGAVLMGVVVARRAFVKWPVALLLPDGRTLAMAKPIARIVRTGMR
jgi:hypothetical protein